jgi:hypothetical protein
MWQAKPGLSLSLKNALSIVTPCFQENTRVSLYNLINIGNVPRRVNPIDYYGVGK